MRSLTAPEPAARARPAAAGPAARPTAPPAWPPGAWWALLATALGFAWRTRELGSQSFWWDEAYSAVVARGSLPEIVAAITAADFHPPLHYVLFHYWRLVAGEGEYALRYVSVAAGTLAIALAFATGRRLFGRAGGLAAATLTAASPYLVYYSTEARMFGLAALLALLTVYTGHRAAATGRRRDWLAFALAVATSLWNYYYAAFTCLPLAVTAAARGPRRLAQYLAAGLLGALLYLPWVPVAFSRAVEWTSPWTPPTSPSRVLAWTWPALLTGIPALELWGSARLAPAMLAVAALLALALLAALALGRRAYAANLWLAAATALLPLALMAAIALVRPIYHPRYAMPVAPALALALAGAIALPVRWLLPLRLALALSVAATFGWGLWRYYEGDGLTRDDYRSAIGYLAARERPGDAALTNAPPGFAYYYRGAMPFAEFPTGPYEEAAIVDGLNRLARDRTRLWYVTHALRPSDPEGFVDLQLDRRARPLERRDFGQIRVALYELPAPPAFAPLVFRPLAGGVRIGDDLTLLGVGLDPVAQPAGDELPLTLRWRVARQPPGDLGVWVRLRDEDGFAWGRQDRRPRDSAFRLSSGWSPGAEVTTRHAVPVATGTPPGRYALEVGVYRLDDLGGLDLFDPAGTKIGQSLRLAEIEVVAGQPGRADPSLAGQRAALDGALSLVGSGLSVAEAAAGSQVELTLVWRAEAPPGPRDLVLRLLAADGATVAEQRGPPLRGRYPTDRWGAGELIRDQERLALPATLASGAYAVWAGLAAPGQEARGAEIGRLRVSAVPRRFDLPPVPHPLEVDFGDAVRLAGWELVRTAPDRGRLTLYWRPTGTPAREYRVFNHVLDAASGKILTQRDGVPVNWSRPTTGWVAGESIEDVYDLELPPGARLRLRTGVYEPTGGQRLLTPAGADYVDLTELAP
jgi:hypothetical protein